MKKIDEAKKRLTEHLNKLINCDSKEVNAEDLLKRRGAILSQSPAECEVKGSLFLRKKDINLSDLPDDIPDDIDAKLTPIEIDSIVRKKFSDSKTK